MHILKFTLRFIDDVFSLNNLHFNKCFDLIYSWEPEDPFWLDIGTYGRVKTRINYKRNGCNFSINNSHFSRVTYPQLLSWRLHISVNPLQSCNFTLYGLREQKGTTYTNNAPTKLRGRTT